MGKRGYPQQSLETIEPNAIQEIVSNLKELHGRGRPKNDIELQQRIDEYFAFCQQSSLRPGIEGLCLSLSISRQTLYRWASGKNCSQACTEMIQTAKSFIASFIEQCVLGGKINPASGIFLMKNWFDYKDTLSFEEVTAPESERKEISLEEIQARLLEDEPKRELLTTDENLTQETVEAQNNELLKPNIYQN